MIVAKRSTVFARMRVRKKKNPGSAQADKENTFPDQKGNSLGKPKKFAANKQGKAKKFEATKQKAISMPTPKVCGYCRTEPCIVEACHDDMWDFLEDELKYGGGVRHECRKEVWLFFMSRLHVYSGEQIDRETPSCIKMVANHHFPPEEDILYL